MFSIFILFQQNVHRKHEILQHWTRGERNECERSENAAVSYDRTRFFLTTRFWKLYNHLIARRLYSRVRMESQTEGLRFRRVWLFVHFAEKVISYILLFCAIIVWAEQM